MLKQHTVRRRAAGGLNAVLCGPRCCSLTAPFNHECADVIAHAAAALTTAMSDMLRRKRADLAAAQQIFIKAQLVAGDSGCQSCVMQ